MKRGVDTALLMYELIDSGTDSASGREVIRALNTIHRRWQIEPEDYEYVLSTFIVVPLRFADRYGWRSPTSTEREAACVFYGEMGRLMGMRRLPGSYAEAEAWLDSYEAANMSYSHEAAEIEVAIEGAVRRRIPWVPAPLAGRAARIVTQGLLGTSQLCQALGVPPSPRIEHMFYLRYAGSSSNCAPHAPSPRVLVPPCRAGEAGVPGRRIRAGTARAGAVILNVAIVALSRFRFSTAH